MYGAADGQMSYIRVCLNPAIAARQVGGGAG
jgi:hypothetical protein